MERAYPEGLGDRARGDLPVDPDLPPPPRTAGRSARVPTARAARNRPSVLLVVAFGGAIGGSARYEVGRWVPAAPTGFPWATFAENVSGALLLGVLLVLLVERWPPNRYARPFLGTGVIGSYTTFSTYAVETDLLVRHGRAGLAAAYAVGSIAAGLFAAWLGLGTGRWIAGLGRT